MRNILKLGVFLLLISGIAGLGIAYVYQLTGPLIVEQLVTEKANSLLEVYPEGDVIADESAKYLDSKTDPVIKGLHIAYEDNNPVGAIYLVEPSAYNGTIQLMVGFDMATRKTTGIKILSQAETPGLGANAEDSFFTDRFKGKSIEEPLEVVKQEPAGDNQILAITSATITSKAVANGVNIARAHFTENFVQ
ncbi:MAG: FMN-binding protein [Peptococcia bacterium]|jgi:electron transport complex protein RnfG